MDYYVIKNNLTEEYFTGEGFDTFSRLGAYQYQTREEAAERKKDIMYYSDLEQGELSIYKVTTSMEEVK